MINPKLRMPLTETLEFPITGYFDRLSRRAGESLKTYISTQAASFNAKLVRVISGDANPDSAGMVFEDLEDQFSRRFEGRHQPIKVGSYVEIAQGPTLAADRAHTWSALCWFTCTPEGESVIVSHADADRSILMSVIPEGLRGEVRSGDKSFDVTVEHEWRLGAWSRIWLSLDPKERLFSVGVEQPSLPVALRQTQIPAALCGPSGGGLTIGARAVSPRLCFTGKIEAPSISVGYVGEEGWSRSTGRLTFVAEWDFAEGISSTNIVGLGPGVSGGVTVNNPTRAVTGAAWSGHETCWRHAPGEYAAIYFHADDVGDLGWAETFTFDIPPDLKSGSYALHLTCEAGEDWLPFYVLPPRQGPREKLVFLVPTYTYLAYANCFFGNRSPEGQARSAEWGASPYNGRDFGSYGRSTYNWHVDGSGVAFSSRLRPILNMRPGYIFANDSKGSGARHYPADTHLLAWLEAKGIKFDVVTDEDLDDEGVDLIKDYAAVMTGTHPEYHTSGTLNALAAYVGGGGNLAYLGANGFYWRIARDRLRPDLIEVRRAEGGIRLWAAESGEYFHAIDGQLGGLWRRNGRSPQALTGVGFSSQGPFDATYFRRTEASKVGPCAWVFEGVEGDIVGDYGLSAGGAAGFELDRMDQSLGSPQSAVVLATSEGLPASFSVAPEDMLTESLSLAGEPPAALVRGDMTYSVMPGGGAVFASGSITFCGSLWRDRKPEGPISTVLENVLNRFLA
jgi:N,N-dimethylformamidase